MYALGCAELQSRKHRSEIVNAHIAKAARAKVPPAAPAERSVTGMIRPPRRRPKPEVPIQRSGHWRSILWTIDALGPVQRHLAPVRRTIGPDVYLAHRT